MARLLKLLLGLLLMLAPALAQVVTVSGKVEVASDAPKRTKGQLANVVVWLTRADGETPRPEPVVSRLVQKDKSFQPPVIVVPTGSSVEFPNRDPFFHNVFSLFEGKRFDLGLYEAGTSRTVKFDRNGVSYIFCNIHPQMSAVVISLDTPYYAISDAGGDLILRNVPEGEYDLHVFAEGLSSDMLKKLSRRVSVKQAASSLGILRVPERKLALAHKNKYGRDYEPSTGTSYEH